MDEHREHDEGVECEHFLWVPAPRATPGVIGPDCAHDESGPEQDERQLHQHHGHPVEHLAESRPCAGDRLLALRAGQNQAASPAHARERRRAAERAMHQVKHARHRRHEDQHIAKDDHIGVDVQPHIVEHRHHVVDIRIELHGEEVRGHERDHRRDGGAERKEAAHARAAGDAVNNALDDHCADTAEPRRCRDRFEHVRVGPAAGDVPAQSDRRGMQRKGNGKHHQPGGARVRPFPHESHQQQDRRRHVDQPSLGHVVVGEVPVFPRQSLTVGIRRGIDARQLVGQLLRGGVHRGGIGPQPTIDQRLKCVGHRHARLGRQVGRRLVLLGQQKHRARHGLLAVGKHHLGDSMPRLLRVAIAARNDAQARQQKARILHIECTLDGIDGLSGAQKIALHLAQHHDHLGPRQQSGRDQASRAERDHALTDVGQEILREHRIGDTGARPRALHKDHIGIAVGVRTQQHVEIGKEWLLPDDLVWTGDKSHRLAGKAGEALESAVGLHGDGGERRQINPLRERQIAISGKPDPRKQQKQSECDRTNEFGGADGTSHNSHHGTHHDSHREPHREPHHGFPFFPADAPRCSRLASTSAWRRRLITGLT